VEKDYFSRKLKTGREVMTEHAMAMSYRGWMKQLETNDDRWSTDGKIE